MALPFYNWSRTAASNATADATVNWAEGMAPSAVNDSGRAMMASAAGFRDDIAGAIATGGTSTAYTVTSYQVFSSLATMANQVIAFTPHTTNGATVTLNVDGLGAKPLRSAPSVELNAGTLIEGTPYTCLYDNSDAVFYLHNFYGNAYNIPLAGGLPFFGTTAPNSAFVFPYGQAISRTTYATLFAITSTTFGTGDGSTTFNLPDLRGRVLAALDNMGGTPAARLTNGDLSAVRHTLGGAGGEDVHTLALAKLPTGITSTNSGAISLSVTSTAKTVSGPNSASAQGGGTQVTNADAGSGAVHGFLSSTGTIAIGDADVTSNNTTGEAHNNIQPTILCNYIMRVI